LVKQLFSGLGHTVRFLNALAGGSDVALEAADFCSSDQSLNDEVFLRVSSNVLEPLLDLLA
jgi:hypothetical protein